MLFPTFEFAVFFIFVFTITNAIGERLKLRQIFLLLASYWFYAAWDWRFLSLLVVSGLMNWMIGILIVPSDKIHKSSSDIPSFIYGLKQKLVNQSTRKSLLVLGIVFNVSVLGTFKYYDFFIENLAEFLSVIGWSRDLIFFDILAPVGISFYTFQGISFIVDMYRGKIEKNPTLVETLLFISFFPQLVAGPLLRANQFLPQLQSNAAVMASKNMFCTGLIFILVGLLKKMVIAETLAKNIVEPVFFDPSSFGSFDLLMAVYAYAVQIYCDFSGYTDIAIGVAALLGYRFERNFNLPYRATSIRDFWRRWHISLSTWLRDYIYIPLGGSKKGILILVRNVIFTMLAGGFWHGASWKFIVWGLLHGVMLAIEHSLLHLFNNKAVVPSYYKDFGTGLIAIWLRLFRKIDNILYNFIGRIYAFNVVCLGWILFRASDFSSAITMIKGIALFQQETIPQYATPFIVVLVFVCLALHLILPDNKLPRNKFSDNKLIANNTKTDLPIEPIEPIKIGNETTDNPLGRSEIQTSTKDDKNSNEQNELTIGGIWWKLGRKISTTHPAFIGVGFGLSLAIILTLAPDGISPFIYFQF